MANLLIQAAVGAAVNYGIGLIARALAPEQVNQGPRLSKSNMTFASENAVVSRHWGRNRLAGNVIWSTKFLEQKTTTSSGGKGGGGGRVTTEEFSYSVSFAVAFCEGNARTMLGRIYADNELLDLSEVTYRFYPGSETQTADTFIETVEGAGNVPAYRGLCYLVFENFPVDKYGRRAPQITAEIIKGPPTVGADDLEGAMTGITLIPSAGEFIYGTTPVTSSAGDGNTRSENVHNTAGITDLVRSLDRLDDAAPNISTVSLVISWFGDDLRCASCTIRPKVDDASTGRIDSPAAWAAGDLTRETALMISVDDEDRPYYGGTPSDLSVREAIAELKSRGYRVVIYPFILMDVPPDNTLPDPYSDNAASTGQSAFPWRGRITPSPAVGYVGSVDKTATAGTQVASFTGTAAAGDFGAWDGSTIPYTGPDEWTFRRFILHYATLVSDVLESGDAFIIGSEMVTMTTARDAAASFPFVDDLVTLASDVNGILPSGVDISYAADWSEYHSHRPSDGSGDVYFHLDPLWSSSDITAVAIDNYLPLSDWRDSYDHLDLVAGADSIYDISYLQGNLEGGEYYDWFYANQTDRDSQTRTTISDGAYSKPWVFRNKDIRNWWLNAHYNRPGGTESGSPTSWAAESKPIWFTEFGCPAVDKGANQPNVFIDAKSSESAYPHYSLKTQDDLIQRRYIEATLTYWRDNAPTSSVYADKMIEPDNMLVWTWDARPYPAFPYSSNVWSDGENWRLGHWLTGRIPQITLADVVTEICASVNLTSSDIDVSGLTNSHAVVRGFSVQQMTTPRQMIQTLEEVYFFDSYQSQGSLKFTMRIDPGPTNVSLDDLVTESSNAGGYSLTRARETDLPFSAKVTYINEANNFQVSTLQTVRQNVSSEVELDGDYTIVMPGEQAKSVANIHVMEPWVMRTTGTFKLPPSKFFIDPGDVISMTVKGRDNTLRVGDVKTGESREISVASFDREIYKPDPYQDSDAPLSNVSFYGSTVVEFLDLPVNTEDRERKWAPRVAAYQNPWPGSVNIYQDDNNSGWDLNTVALDTAVIGELTSPLSSGALSVWDYANDVDVKVYSNDQILGTSELAVLNGVNIACVQNADGGWEVFQFQNATLTGTREYTLSKLLRGQGGTEGEMRDPVAAGARVVFLSQSNLYTLDISLDTIFSDIDFRYGPGTVAVTDDRYQTETVTVGAVGLRPFSPVHLAGTLSGGDWSLTWIRRTRFGGDSWSPASVPLNEESEEYELEIMDGATVVRTVQGLTSPAFTYTAAMQTADFGSGQSTVTFRVYQMSVIYGRGSVAEGTV